MLHDIKDTKAKSWIIDEMRQRIGLDTESRLKKEIQSREKWRKMSRASAMLVVGKGY